MKKLINYFKKLFGYKEVCPKCKSNPCECQLELPTEHVRTVEDSPVVEKLPESTISVEFPLTESEAATKPVVKKKRAPRKKKVTA